MCDLGTAGGAAALAVGVDKPDIIVISLSEPARPTAVVAGRPLAAAGSDRGSNGSGDGPDGCPGFVDNAGEGATPLGDRSAPPEVGSGRLRRTELPLSLLSDNEPARVSIIVGQRRPSASRASERRCPAIRGSSGVEPIPSSLRMSDEDGLIIIIITGCKPRAARERLPPVAELFLRGLAEELLSVFVVSNKDNELVVTAGGETGV